MDELQKYLENLDVSEIDHTSFYDIDKEIQNLRDELARKENIRIAEKAQLELEILNLNKFVKEGLNFKFSGTQKNESGEDIPFEWPDIKTFDTPKFEYVKKRFDETKNTFLKTEYGLVLLLSPQSTYKNNQIAIQVLENLIELHKKYRKKILPEEKKIEKQYYVHFILVLVNSFELAKLRKNNAVVLKLYGEIKLLIIDVFKKISVKHEHALRIYADTAKLMIENYKEFKPTEFNLNYILEKIWQLANYISKSYLYGGIDLANLGISFQKRWNLENGYGWLQLKGENYTRLAHDAENKKDTTAVKFYEDALNVYKKLGDKKNIRVIESKFLEIKNKAYGIGKIKSPIPEEESKRIYDKILNVVSTSNELEIISFIIASPMIMKVEKLNEISLELSKKPYLLNLMPSSVIDKRGFTVKTYRTPDEIKEFNRLRNFEIDFQFASMNLFRFYVEAVKASKLSYKSIKKFLSKSWVGQSYKKEYQGKYYEIKPLDLILPSLKLIFNEITKSLKSSKYNMNLVCPIDSLTLKLEFLIRLFCEILDIPTYRDVNTEKGLKEEKDVNVLLNDESVKKNLLDDDIFLLKFILVERMGYNLRNIVAHGLYDRVEEYDASKAVILITLLLKISSYKFINKEDIHNETSK